MGQTAAAEAALAQRIEAVRGFNRFYTQKIGVLQEGLLASPFSLAEARVLYELARRGPITASGLIQTLGLDAGYLSRILRRFEKRRLVARSKVVADGRQSLLSLTKAGNASFAALDARSRAAVSALLTPLPTAEQDRLVAAMGAVERTLGAAPHRGSYTLRPHRPGDMGWIIQRHGALYAQEYGWDESFEALVAEIAAAFIKRRDPRRERCWIAELDGERVGSVFVVRKSKTVAKLRLLLVEPRARGYGIGRRLVDECVRFARAAGYRTLTLWTQSELTAARRLYQQAGFERVEIRHHDSFGKKGLVAETWNLHL
jgi:DNA-binding MarR family transcriptional regulator/GNAT superfamily N-acetyltransferase